jgi:protein-tyrosine phosphatase
MPPKGTELRQAGFNLLVLCAYEYQPHASDFPGVSVLRVPLEDVSDAIPDQVLLAHVQPAASVIAGMVKDGLQALVTCYMGLNRSGLVTGLALRQVTGWPGKDCVARIREARGPFALGNSQFRRLVEDKARPGWRDWLAAG